MPRDVVAVDVDDAAVGLHQAGDHVEDRGLAGAVRAEQADRLAARHREAGVVHHRAAAVGLGEAARHQPAAPAGVRDQPRRRLFRRAALRLRGSAPFAPFAVSAGRSLVAGSIRLRGRKCWKPPTAWHLWLLVAAR